VTNTCIGDVQGGKLFFLEHVYAKRGAMRWFQRLMRWLWMVTIYACDLCCDTDLKIRAAGFRNVELEEFDAIELVQPDSIMPGSALMRPHISGTATK